MDSMNDKYSIKNLLFVRAIPSYVIPVPIGGHKVFHCLDCGDKFILESSYDQHVNRKSVQISYLCRSCNEMKIFYNRCNLLSHIRSHTFKTATINVSDLKIDPLPIGFINMQLCPVDSSSSQISQTENIRYNKKGSKSICFDCKNDITETGIIYKDRAKHYMQFTNEVYSCPVCMFAMPTLCGLRAHLRVHLKCPPYYCPECGIHLPNKTIFYPYNHDCEGFKKMRATARLSCPMKDCQIYHPNEYKDHLRESHLKKVFKCPFCYVACFVENIMAKHLKGHAMQGKGLIFYQCEMCPGRLVLQNQIENHLKGHVSNSVYPCWSCGIVFQNVPNLIEHHRDNHDLQADALKFIFNSILQKTDSEKLKKIYRVVKRCDQCKRSYTYKCKFNEIRMLPNECFCSSTFETDSQTVQIDSNTGAQITCHICKEKVSESWDEIKKHYATHHKPHICLDAKVVVKKMDISKFLKRKNKRNMKPTAAKKRRRKNKNRNEPTVIVSNNIMEDNPNVSESTGQYVCNKCGHRCENQEDFETHIISHRDPCMAYQCMECGESFVVKPSFSTHLLLEHGESDVNDYITRKQCYNENALMKYQDTVSTEPLRENQCRICREQFDNSGDLEKHFRVHGMAFLMKNKNISP